MPNRHFISLHKNIGFYDMLFLVWNHLFIYFAMLVFILHVGNFFLISSLGIKKKRFWKHRRRWNNAHNYIKQSNFQKCLLHWALLLPAEHFSMTSILFSQVSLSLHVAIRQMLLHSFMLNSAVYYRSILLSIFQKNWRFWAKRSNE